LIIKINQKIKNSNGLLLFNDYLIVNSIINEIEFVKIIFASISQLIMIILVYVIFLMFLF